MKTKRLNLSPDEVAIIEGLRHERAVYNQALQHAATEVASIEDNSDDGAGALQNAVRAILALRKA